MHAYPSREIHLSKSDMLLILYADTHPHTNNCTIKQIPGFWLCRVWLYDSVISCCTSITSWKLWLSVWKRKPQSHFSKIVVTNMSGPIVLKVVQKQCHIIMQTNKCKCEMSAPNWHEKFKIFRWAVFVNLLCIVSKGCT